MWQNQKNDATTVRAYRTSTARPGWGVTVWPLVALIAAAAAVAATLLFFRATARTGRARDEAERCRRFVDEMPALVCSFRPDTTLTYVNRAYAAYFDRRPEELVGTRFIELIPEDAREGVLRGLEPLIGGEAAEVTHEHEVLNPDGDRRWQQWRNRTIRVADGATEIESIGIDTTERRQAQLALDMSEERFRAVFGSMRDAILILDDVGRRIADVNQAGLELYGATRERLVDAPFTELVHGEPPAELVRWFETPASERAPVRQEWRATRDGSFWWVAATLSMARIDGEDRALCVVRDASEQKLLEEQLLQSQKMETVGTLAGGLAHDVNNVLTAIIGHAEEARGGLEPAGSATRSLDAIVEVCRQAGSITRSLLTFSQRGSGAPEAIDMRRVVAHAVELLRPLLPDAIDVTLDGAEGPPIWIDADRTQVQQIVMNLVLNSRDAMRDGGALRVSVDSRQISDMERAVLRVDDDGCGMSAEVQRRVIEPFFTTKARGQGTGLGMSIVHGVVTRQGGRMTIDSEEANGTRVTIELPRCAAPEHVTESDHTGAAATAATVSQAQGTVLLIEDNVPVRDVLARGLAAQGYDVLHEGDGVAGLRVFEEEAERLSLVVVDVDLPRKGGPECVREMQRRHAGVPTILISGNARQTVDVELGERVEFLQKPFRIAQLAELGQRMISEAGSSPGDES